MSWKQALYDFMNTRNRMETFYGTEELHRHGLEEGELQAERLLQDRRREHHRIREVTPGHAETKLALTGIETSNGAILAKVRLLQKVDYHRIGGGLSHTEERCLSEQVELRMTRGSWQVAKIIRLGEKESDALVLASEPPPSTEESPVYSSENRLPPVSRSPHSSYSSRSGIPYRRELAAAYADRWWNSANPQFLLFDVDCTNYVSQCLFAGEAPMNYTGRRALGWWYRGRSGNAEQWSYSWSVANSLRILLAGKQQSGLRAEEVSSAAQLQLGDVICYSWAGDGRFGHSTVVTAFDAKGQPLVNAHTVSSRHRYWDYTDSYAWTERTMYRFFHILDEL